MGSESDYETRIVRRVQTVWRPNRLAVSAAPADAVILDIVIGGRSQLIAEGGGIPWRMFDPTAVGTRLDLPTVSVGDEIVLVVGSEEGGQLSAVFFGVDANGTTFSLGFSDMLGGVEPLVEVAREKLGLNKPHKKRG